MTFTIKSEAGRYGSSKLKHVALTGTCVPGAGKVGGSTATCVDDPGTRVGFLGSSMGAARLRKPGKRICVNVRHLR